MLEGKKCTYCGKTYVIPAYSCNHCGNKDFDYVKFSGKGKVYSYTTVHVPPVELQDDAPYTIGLVDLDEGLRITVRLNLTADQLEIGKKVAFIERKSKFMIFG